MLELVAKLEESLHWWEPPVISPNILLILVVTPSLQPSLQEPGKWMGLRHEAEDHLP